MWIVTIEAPLVFIQGAMGELHVSNALAQILMTIETEFAARFYENKLVIRSMGIVTFLTMAFDHNPMSATRFLRQYLFVATVADSGRGGGQQILVVGGVGVVASDTFPGFKKGM